MVLSGDLEEAIKHAQETADRLAGTPCGEDHDQLANWLIELQHMQ